MPQRVRARATETCFAYLGGGNQKSATRVRAGRHYWVTPERAEQPCFERAPVDTSLSTQTDSSASEAPEPDTPQHTGDESDGPESAAQPDSTDFTCQGTTADGEPCTRHVSNDYCWQHR